MKKFKRILGAVLSAPLVRGIIKTLPGGSFAYEAAENVRDARRGERKKHSGTSLFIQFVLLVIIVYAFVTKHITIDQVIRYITMQDLWDAGPDGAAISDSLNTVSK